MNRYLRATLKKMDKPVVDTSFGALFGRVSEDSNGKSYYSFQGIPYAKPPVGQLRFKVNITQCYNSH